MSLEVEAVYADGVLKPDQPLPLGENERVVVRIEPKTSRIRRSAGSIPWTGSPEDLRKIAEDPRFGILESP